MKMPSLTAVLVGWAILTMPAAALTSAGFPLHLYDSDDSSERFACFTYITGALEMCAGYQNYWSRQSAKIYCASETLDSDTVEKLWREELTLMPAELQVDAALTLSLSVMDKFPCPDKVPSDQNSFFRLTPPLCYLTRIRPSRTQKGGHPVNAAIQCVDANAVLLALVAQANERKIQATQEDVGAFSDLIVAVYDVYE